MNQNIFKEKVLSHIQHVIKVGSHCSTEETTKQALILPLLDILGFNPYDPTKVRAEYGADFPGVKNGERVDYALFCHDVPVMFIEAKSYNENLSNHVPQLARYFNATPEVTVAAVTNGREWRFFTDLKDKNIMDESPFLRINFENVDDSKINQLSQFCHDRFQPEALRTLAEESVYLSAFTKTISESLKEVDSEFVRYVAGRSNVGRQLNQRFIDAITPIVKQAVEKAVSAMVVSRVIKTGSE
ncbi:type I restriction endonuclease [Actinobacillus equuli subsp. haemolyticus]|nr:type I restriction endonuclease [Actinobacillus equuli]WGE59787.1 type I restriction endonuclease [Actinobacillus equuli subsp. haemolyticus]WGE61568.1 type I restriction endonuclease [Actinobacillus equuli subsp. haemolyticus]